ncbi:Uncharacterized protein Fot_55549 [Forsythia ovata]|uniref:Uncharacterized protein n=1 Tax=Forsythia ovata TaxID=205694 RepID=A0ABD1P4F4_9LAMI
MEKYFKRLCKSHSSSSLQTDEMNVRHDDRDVRDEIDMGDDSGEMNEIDILNESDEIEEIDVVDDCDEKNDIDVEEDRRIEISLQRLYTGSAYTYDQCLSYSN